MSNGPQFFETQMGRRFYESTVPKIAKSLERIAVVLERERVRSPTADPEEPETFVPPETFNATTTDAREADSDVRVDDALRRILALAINPHWTPERRWRIAEIAQQAINELEGRS